MASYILRLTGFFRLLAVMSLVLSTTSACKQLQKALGLEEDENSNSAIAQSTFSPAVSNAVDPDATGPANLFLGQPVFDYANRTISVDWNQIDGIDTYTASLKIGSCSGPVLEEQNVTANEVIFRVRDFGNYVICVSASGLEASSELSYQPEVGDTVRAYTNDISTATTNTLRTYLVKNRYDSQGNLYVLAFREGVNSTYRFSVVKYNSSGEAVTEGWPKDFDVEYFEGVGLEINSFDEVIVYSRETVNNYWTARISAFSSSGTELWTKNIGYTDKSIMVFQSLALHNGEILIGFREFAALLDQSRILKLNRDGNVASGWDVTYELDATYWCVEDRPTQMAASATHVYVTYRTGERSSGECTGGGAFSASARLVVAKYDLTGTEVTTGNWPIIHTNKFGDRAKIIGINSSGGPAYTYEDEMYNVDANGTSLAGWPSTSTGYNIEGGKIDGSGHLIVFVQTAGDGTPERVEKWSSSGVEVSDSTFPYTLSFSYNNSGSPVAFANKGDESEFSFSYILDSLNPLTTYSINYSDISTQWQASEGFARQRDDYFLGGFVQENGQVGYILSDLITRSLYYDDVFNEFTTHPCPSALIQDLLYNSGSFYHWDLDGVRRFDSECNLVSDVGYAQADAGSVLFQYFPLSSDSSKVAGIEWGAAFNMTTFQVEYNYFLRVIDTSGTVHQSIAIDNTIDAGGGANVIASAPNGDVAIFQIGEAGFFEAFMADGLRVYGADGNEKLSYRQSFTSMNGFSYFANSSAASFDSSGRLYLAGYSAPDSQYAIIRLNTDGSLDTSWKALTGDIRATYLVDADDTGVAMVTQDSEQTLLMIDKQTGTAKPEYTLSIPTEYTLKNLGKPIFDKGNRTIYVIGGLEDKSKVPYTGTDPFVYAVKH